MANRKYTREFKLQALELVKQTGTFSEAARQLGITDGLLHTWKQKFNFKLDSDKSAKASAQESDEVRELKNKISDLEKTNYILKRAAAFFSQDHLK